MRSLVLLGLAALASSIFAAERPPASVRVDIVVELDVAPSTWVPGTVLSVSDAKIAAEIAGRLTMVAVAGAEVEENAVIARVDAKVLEFKVKENQARIRQLQARLKFDVSEVRRLALLAENNNAAITQLESAQSKRDVAAQELDIARTALEQTLYALSRTRIRAPFAGRIAERLQEPGEYAVVGKPVVRLVDTHHLEVRAQAPIRLAPFVALGMLVRVVWNEAAPAIYPVTTIIPVGDTTSRSFEVRLAMLGSSWVIGTPVRVSLPVQVAKRTLAVPRDAIVLRQDGVYVFRILDGDLAERVTVETGFGADDLIEVLGELAVGDLVVVRGAEMLRDGQKVSQTSG
ncbi:MAG: efflux RND transporter periplasmic adaptor subunit [Gammaproteobacteria bacterium]|nr:efflux RND transporter periplasmic adaptor subunit [Gammaproteobacteria bacterium]